MRNNTLNRWHKTGPVLAALVLTVAALMTWYLKTYDAREPSRMAYANYCASCHGERLQGTGSGPPLIGAELVGGGGTQQLISSINQHSDKRERAGSLDWGHLPAHTIKALALYVSESRQALPTTPNHITPIARGASFFPAPRLSHRACRGSGEPTLFDGTVAQRRHSRCGKSPWFVSYRSRGSAVSVDTKYAASVARNSEDPRQLYRFGHDAGRQASPGLRKQWMDLSISY